MRFQDDLIRYGLHKRLEWLALWADEIGVSWTGARPWKTFRTFMRRK